MSTVIISCTTLMDAVQCAQQMCGTRYPVYELDRAYHEDPAKMRQQISKIRGAAHTEYRPQGGVQYKCLGNLHPMFQFFQGRLDASCLYLMMIHRH